MSTQLIRCLLRAAVPAALAALASAQQVSLSAFLSGAFETPANASPAKGSAKLSYDQTSGLLSYDVSVSGLSATAAHIHTGAAGVPGGILIPLVGGPTSWSGTAALPTGALTALLHAGLYINLHTSAFPSGEVRGQILISENFVSNLNGANEVPANNSTAIAEAQTMVDRVTGALSCKLEFTGLTPTDAHLHRGPAGVAGPIVFPLVQTAPSVFELSSTVLNDVDLLDLLTGRLYLNVHSAAFPGGEIRDQVVAAGINSSGNSMSVVNGGTLDLALDFGANTGSKLYLVLGSLSGTSPGIPISGALFPLPLNPDAYFNYTLANHSVPLSSSFGVLDPSGKGTAKFTLPALSDPTLAGLVAHHAAIAIDPLTFVPEKPTCATKLTL
jgi:hypothetical protein